MIWLFTLGGAVIGGIFWGGGGLIAFAMLGWLVGLIVNAQRDAKKPATGSSPAVKKTAVVATKPGDPIAQRLALVEARLAAIEKHLGVIPAEAGIQSEAQVAPVTLDPVVITEPASIPEPDFMAEPPPPPPPPKPPAPPPKPNFIVAFFTGGNTIVRVGLVVLFFGLAFLVKYGVDHDMIPIEVRIMGVAAAGIALLGLGWWLRGKRREYALSLQGAGVAVLYLTIFGSMRLYHLVPPTLAFFLLVFIAIFSGFLAVIQDSFWLAVFAAAGGFLAPIFASTGQGSHVMLFSYYLLLNATIVGIAWFKAWRLLNLVGFAFTALIGLAWGIRSYNDELFASTEPFLIAFFLMYFAIAILFARLQAARAERIVDGTIVFGAPIFAFGLQAGMLHGTEFGLAWTCLAMALLYIGTAWILHQRAAPSPLGEGRGEGHRWRLLVESFLALGVVFGTLAIPLALDARWTSASWALEGAAVFWVGVRQNRRLARFFALFLEFAAGFAFLASYDGMPPGPPLADARFVGALLLSLAGLYTNRLIGRSSTTVTRVERWLSPLLFLWGLLWLIVAMAHEIETFVPDDLRYASFVALVGAIALGFGMLGKRIDWKEGSWPALAFVPMLFLMMGGVNTAFLYHPFANFAWISWIFVIGAHFWLMKRGGLERYGKWFTFMHAGGAVLIATLGGVELGWLAAHETARGTAWSLASRIVAPSVVILIIASRAMDTRWPVRDALGAYRLGAVGALVVFMALWSLFVNLSHGGGSDPLPYLPILNALDLAHILALFAMASAVLALRRSGLGVPPILTSMPFKVIAGAILFVWANAILLRTIHHWAGVRYRPDVLWDSVLVQASLSIFWSFLALSLMVFATRKGKRAIWMLGAALMGVVLAKMLFVDLGNLSGIARIVSFIGVGVLMLVIGYFSPVPPKKSTPSPLGDEARPSNPLAGGRGEGPFIDEEERPA